MEAHSTPHSDRRRAGAPARPASWAHRDPKAPGPHGAGARPTRPWDSNIAIGAAQSASAPGQVYWPAMFPGFPKGLRQAAARRHPAGFFVYFAFFLRLLALCAELYPGVLYSSYGTTSQPSPTPCPMRVSFSRSSPSVSCKQTSLASEESKGTHHVPLLLDMLLDFLPETSHISLRVVENVPFSFSFWAPLAPNVPIGMYIQTPGAIVAVLDAVVDCKNKANQSESSESSKELTDFLGFDVTDLDDCWNPVQLVQPLELLELLVYGPELKRGCAQSRPRCPAGPKGVLTASL